MLFLAMHAAQEAFYLSFVSGQSTRRVATMADARVLFVLARIAFVTIPLAFHNGQCSGYLHAQCISAHTCGDAYREPKHCAC